MGDRNHLHICQHCGVVHATASSTGPETCVACEAFTFSSYELNRLLQGSNTGDPATGDTDTEPAKRPSPVVVRS